MQIILAEREAQLMEVLWDRGPSTVTDVQARLNDELAYTTVLSHLRALESRGYVGHSEEGRAHRYHALIERADARKGAIVALVTRLFKGSSDALHLLRAQLLERPVLGGSRCDPRSRGIRKQRS